MANTVNILIKADDQASKEIDNVNEKARGLGGTLTDVGKIAGGFLAAEAIGVGFQKLNGFVTDSIAGFREQMTVTAQTKAVIESTGGAAGVSADQVLALAESIKRQSLFADDAVQSGENLLLTFTNIGADIFPRATQAMVDMSQALGQDLGSSAIQLGKALNDPIEGVTALRRVGVSFTEQQMEQIKVMQESGDIAGAQALILAELEREFSGSAKAASDAAGASETYNDRMDDLNDTIGEKLLPIHEKWKEAQLAVIDVLLTQLAPAIKKVAEEAGPYFHRFMEYWETDIKPAVDNIRAAFEALSPFLMPILNQIADMVKITVQLITGSLDIIIKLLSGDFAGAWESSKNLIKNYRDYVVSTFENMRDLVTAIFGGLAEAAIGKLSGMKMGLLNAAADIKYGLIEAFQQTKDWIGRVWDGIVDVIKWPINQAIGFINRLISAWNGLSFGVGGGSFMGVSIPRLDIQTPDVGTIPYLASGGVVTRPTLAMIGEAGPEAVIPLNRAGGMGTTNNYYISVSSLDPQSSATLVQKVLVHLERRGGIAAGTTRAVTV